MWKLINELQISRNIFPATGCRSRSVSTITLSLCAARHVNVWCVSLLRSESHARTHTPCICVCAYIQRHRTVDHVPHARVCEAFWPDGAAPVFRYRIHVLMKLRIQHRNAQIWCRITKYARKKYWPTFLNIHGCWQNVFFLRNIYWCSLL